MLFKIPQNIIISLSLILLGFVLVWHSVAENVVILFKGSHSLLDTAIIENADWLKVLFVALSAICSYVVYQINKAYRFVEGNSIPFIIFTSIGLSTCLISSVSIVDTFSVLLSCISLFIVLRIHNQSSVLGLLILSSLVLGGAALLYYPSLIIFLIAVLTIAFFRPFEVRNYIVIAVSVVLTGFYLFSLSFLFDWEYQLPDIKFVSFKNISPFKTTSIPLISFCLLSFIGAIKMFSDRAKFVVRQRNQLIIISLFMLIQLVLFLMLGDTAVWVSIIPIFSIFIVYYYKTSARKWLLDVITLLFIVALIWLKL